MSEGHDDEAVPVLAYQSLGEDQEMAWALRYVGWWIIAMSILTMAETPAQLGMSPQVVVLALVLGAVVAVRALRVSMRTAALIGLAGFAIILALINMIVGFDFQWWWIGLAVIPLATPFAGSLIGLAVQKRQRLGMIAAVILVLLTPLGLLEHLYAPRQIVVFIGTPMVVNALVDAAVLWVLVRQADRSGMLLPARSGRAVASLNDTASVFVMRLLGYHFIGKSVAVLLQLGAIVALENDSVIPQIQSWDAAMFLGSFAMLAVGGGMMISRRITGLPVAIGAMLAILLAGVMSMLTTPASADWGYLIRMVPMTVVVCALLWVLYRRVSEGHALPVASAVGQ